MRSAIKNVVGRALLHHPPAIQHHHLVAQPSNHAQVVGDQDNRRAKVALQLAQQDDDLCLHRHVKRRGGFIGNQHFGLTQQSHGNHHALAHTARKLVRVHVDAARRFGDFDGV